MGAGSRGTSWCHCIARGEGTGSLQRRASQEPGGPEGPEVTVVVGTRFKDAEREMQGNELGKETGG